MARNLYLIFLLFTLLFTSNIYAADDGDWWLQRQITLQQNREDYARRVYGSARHTYDVVDPKTSKATTITKTVVIEDVPTRGRIGRVLLERAKKYRGGVAGVLGGAAVTGLIEAVGWVMEEGTFVKYKEPDQDAPPNEYQYLYGFLPADKQPCWCDTATDAAQTVSLASTEDVKYIYKSIKDLGNKNYAVILDVEYPKNPVSNQKNVQRNLNKRLNPNGIPEPKPKKILISPEDVGGLVVGDYNDPVDPKYNLSDRQYREVVKDAYQHDPTGTGNEIAKQTDERIRNAPPTSDGKPAPQGDPRYQKAPNNDQTTNDRSWDDDPNKANGDTTPKTDPTTGQPTGGQSISLQFPVFCEWAHTMCKWYDDWKVSDKRDAKFQEDLTKHNTEEKTFWQTVKDWFTWSKDGSGLPARDNSDLNTTVDFEEKKIGLNVSPQCPAPTFETITLHGVTAQIKTSDYTYICQLDWLIKPFTIGFASVLACFILFGFNRGSDD